MKKNILNLFGLGKTRFSASTASLLAVLVYFLATKYSTDSQLVHKCILVIITIPTIFDFYKNPKAAKEDAGEIVIDEFMGMYVCLFIAGTMNPLALAVLFVLFRIVDILKPPPFSWIDGKIKNGFGVVADDVAIGIFLGFAYLLFLRVIS